jgi:hypothetical protein
VEHSRGETRNRLVSEIMAHAMHIAEDPYGFASPEIYNKLLQYWCKKY